MADLRTSVRLDLEGNFLKRSRAYGQSLERLGRQGRRAMSGLGRATAAAGRGLDRLGNGYTALFTGIAAVATGRAVINLDARLTQLGTNADMSAEQVAKLKQQLFAVANDPNIRIDPNELLGAVEGVVEMTGDIEFATNNMRNFGIAIRATNTAGKDIGLISAEFQKMGLVLDKDVLHALALLTEQGESGAFTLQNLAALGPRVITAYTALGRQGLPALRELGAALQVIRKGTGGPEQAATAFEAVLRVMTDLQKLQILQKGGIQVFDPEALKQGKEVLRPINELMNEIIRQSQGRGTVLGRVFDAEAIRAFNAARQEFTRTGQLTELEKFFNVTADGTELMADAATNASTAAAAIQSLSNAWTIFSNKNLAEPIRDLADALNSVDNETVQRWLEMAKTAALVGGGLIVGSKLIRGGAAIFRGIKRMRGGGGIGDLVGAAAGVDGMRVYVTNFDEAGFGGNGGPFTGGGRRGKRIGRTAGRAGRLARTVGRGRAAAGLLGGARLGTIASMGAGAIGTAGASLLAAGAVGYGAGTLAYQYGIQGTSLGNAIGEGIARSLAFFGNDEAQRAVAATEKAELRGSIKIEVDATGRTHVKDLKSDTPGVDLNVYTGPVMRLP